MSASPETSDLVMLTDVEARRALGDRSIRYNMQAPLGAWLGVGRLRVLRVKPSGADGVEIDLGYESYERCDR
jgi:hypothetical protein